MINPFKKSSDADVVAEGFSVVDSASSPSGPVNDSFTHSLIEFPVPWVSRIQTPIKRPIVDSMWGNEIPESYGGPWK